MITRGGGATNPESGALDLPVEPGADLARRDLRVPVVRAEPPSARRPLGQPAPAPARLRDRRLGAVGQRVLPADRRARLRRHLGGLLPALSGRSSPRSGGCWRGQYVLAGVLVSLAACLGGVRAAVPAHGGEARRRRGAAHGRLPRDLPDGAVPRRRLQRVALPAARGRGLRARRARALSRGRRRRGARDPHARDRGRPAAGARA